MLPLSARLEQRLRQQQARGLYRRLQVHDAAQGPCVRVGEEELLNFCSNDYLGLAADRRIAAALASGARRYGSGSGSAHLVCGHSRAHQELEAALADWLGRPRALFFASGWQANTATLAALLEADDLVIEDKLNHASLLDGARLAGARLKRYPHADMEALQRRLCAEPAPLVVSDAVFSMDGDHADVAALTQICRRHGAWLMLDDAHGIGVEGEEGRAAARWSVQDLPVLCVTLGKAIGTQGACVLGEAPLIEALLQFARPYIYSTAASPALAHATLTAITLVRREDWRRQRLAEHIAYFKEQAQRRGWPLRASDSPIQPLMVGDAERALRLAERLRQQGVWVTAIRPPTVAQGQSRLRITFSAAHQRDQIDRLVLALDRAWDEVMR